MMMPARPAAGFLALILMTTGAPGAHAAKLLPSETAAADLTRHGLYLPDGLACGEGTRVLLADAEGARLVELDLAVGSASSRRTIAVPQLPAPVRVATDPQGKIYAVDGKLKKIARLTATGEFEAYIDFLAAGVEGEVAPRSIQVGEDSTIYVLDGLGNRVIVLGPDGYLWRTVPFPATSGFVSDLAVDARGAIYLVDSLMRQVYAGEPGAPELAPLSPPFAKNIGFPASIAVDGSGRVYIGDENGGGILVLGSDGSLQGRKRAHGRREGSLRNPSSLCVNGEGALAVADRQSARLHVFNVAP